MHPTYSLGPVTTRKPSTPADATCPHCNSVQPLTQGLLQACSDRTLTALKYTLQLRAVNISVYVRRQVLLIPCWDTPGSKGEPPSRLVLLRPVVHIIRTGWLEACCPQRSVRVCHRNDRGGSLPLSYLLRAPPEQHARIHIEAADRRVNHPADTHDPPEFRHLFPEAT